MQDLYLFNPDNEISIANGTNGYTPKANISIMAGDLAFLSAYLTGKGDYVLVTKMPDFDFMKSRKEIFGLDCKPIIWEKAQLLSFNEIKPWGWSPRVHNLLKDLKSRCNEQFRESVMATWSEERRGLYSRRVAAACLTDMIRAIPGRGEEGIPCECRTLAEIRLLSEKRDIVVKAPWSSSGKGVLFIPKGQMTGKEEEVLSGFLHKQGYVMVEKRLNRVLDFAMEFEMDRLFHLNFLGYSVFQTSRRGEYEGNRVASNSSLEGMIAKYTGTGFLHEIREQLEKVVMTVFHGKYVGYLGVDMMIYEDESGEFGVQPCVEINLRYNMGIVSIALQRYLQEGVEGVFNIRFSPQAGEIMQSVEKNREVHPLLMEAGRIVSGYINLTPVSHESRFVAELYTKRSLEPTNFRF